MEAPKRIGELLVAAHLITEEQLQAALEAQQESNERIGTILVERGHVTENQLTQILSNQLSVAWVSLPHVEFPRELLSLVPEELARELVLIPALFRRDKEGKKILYVAMDDPTNVPVMERISQLTGMHIRPLIAPRSEILAAIDEHYGEL